MLQGVQAGYLTPESQQGTKTLATELLALPQALQEQLLSLCRHGRAARDMSKEMSACPEALALLQVFAVNSVALSSERSAIYLRASRANHSCRPNGFFRLARDGKLRLVARRRILAGEELCTALPFKRGGSHGDVSAREAALSAQGELVSLALTLCLQEERRSRLENWSFRCRCSRCLAKEDMRSFRSE